MGLSAEEARVVVESQPRLYIEAMLEDYDRAQMADAKEAILTRCGAVLLSTYGVAPTLREIRTEPWKPEPRWDVSVAVMPEPATLREVLKSWWHARR